MRELFSDTSTPSVIILGMPLKDKRKPRKKFLSTCLTRVRVSCPGRDRRWLTTSLIGDWLTFDIMSEVIFGMKYNALKEVKWRHVPTAIQNSNVRVGTLIQAYSLTIGRLDRYLFPASISARNQYLKFIFGMLKNRSKASFSDNGNVFSFLETAKDEMENDKPALRKSEIQAECATLVVAGEQMPGRPAD